MNKNCIVIDYLDLRSEYVTNNLLSAEKKLKTLKKGISLGAGLNSIGNEMGEIIEDFKQEFNIIYLTKYSDAYDVTINNNPLSESMFLLSEMLYKKGRKVEGEEYKNLAIKFDPNNKNYL